MNIGDTIDSYVILKEIGFGGMGKVMLVRDTRDNHEYALKYCTETEPSKIRRFGREIRVMKQMQHDNIVSVLADNMSYDPPYFIMPVADMNLKQYIPQIIGNVVQVIDVFDTICKGVAAMHASTCYHRDLKPNNVLMFGKTPVVSDFGLAKEINPQSSGHESSNWSMGTIAYMAPELMIAGSNADARTDIYLLGKTLYELLTDEVPYLMNFSKIPPSLVHVIRKATENEPDRRYQTVSEFQQAIYNVRLALDPEKNPIASFSTKLDIVKQLADNGTYDETVYLQLLDVLNTFRADPNRLVEMFDKIPASALKVFASRFAAAFGQILTLYAQSLESYAQSGHVDYEYAEEIAKRMKIVYLGTSDYGLKEIALRTALKYAIWFHRYAAMDTFYEIICSVKSEEEGAFVSGILRSQMDDYVVLYDKVPKNTLSPILQTVYDEAEKYREK